MTDHELKRRLAALTTPAADQTARSRAHHRSILALSLPASTAGNDTRPRSHWPRSYAWGMGVMVLAVGMLAGVLQFRVGVSDAPVAAKSPNGGGDLRTLAQVEEFFPGQLNAVIERDGEVQLDLASRPLSGATAQAVVVQLRSGAHHLRVLSYSGRSITLELNNRRLTFEALVTSDGGIVLSGDDFAWSSEQPKPLAGYRIQARLLSAL